MIITRQNLENLRVGFKTTFTSGLALANPMWNRVATRVTSTNASEAYGWLGEIPEVREWVGPRAVHAIEEHDYSIKNVSWEQTIGVPREKIEDDSLGLYEMRFKNQGKQVGQHYDKLVWRQLTSGFDNLCYDGQPFFDEDHPVIGADGVVASVSNFGGGAGAPWYLIDSNQVMLPILLQVRKEWDFVAKDDPRDDNVFTNRQFVYGVDGRCNVGFGFWQMAYSSRQTLNPDNYEVARAAMTGMKGDHGVQLGLSPNLLIVPPTLEGAGRRLLASQLVNGGESNPWANSAELLVVPWLA